MTTKKLLHLRFAVLFAVLVLALLTACAGSGHSGRSHGSRSAIQNETNTDTYTYDLPENARSLTLDLTFQSSQGVFTWQVTDPQGKLAWEGSQETPDGGKQSKALPLTPGRWTLKVQMQQVTGSYDIEWRSR